LVAVETCTRRYQTFSNSPLQQLCNNLSILGQCVDRVASCVMVTNDDGEVADAGALSN
jgi:hypothetical protein